MAKKPKTKPAPPTKRYVEIAEIREDAVVLKDGSMRAVILVSSINFALKSAEEQEAIVQAYIQFLNSLEYSLQIVIQSRRVDIEPYMKTLRERKLEMKNEALKQQVDDYMQFVGELVTLGDIMEKRFLVVVPYDPLSDKQKKFFARVSAAIKPILRIKLKGEQFEERRKALSGRVDNILSLLGSMGLKGAVLDTQSLVELYYSSYNPETYNKEKMADVSKLRVEETLST